jgi:hypothetical protein
MNGDSQSELTREELIALIRAQATEIAALKTRVAELERRLGLDSGNSGKPDETGFRFGGKTQGCMWPAPSGSPSTASAPDAAACWPMWPASWHTITGCPITACRTCSMPCAMLTLIDIEKEDWARKMHRLLRRSSHASAAVPSSRA